MTLIFNELKGITCILKYLVLIAFCLPLNATDMHVWTDNNGVKHISTVDKSCIKTNLSGNKYSDFSCDPLTATKSQLVAIKEKHESDNFNSQLKTISGSVFQSSDNGLYLNAIKYVDTHQVNDEQIVYLSNKSSPYSPSYFRGATYGKSVDTDRIALPQKNKAGVNEMNEELIFVQLASNEKYSDGERYIGVLKESGLHQYISVLGAKKNNKKVHRNK